MASLSQLSRAQKKRKKVFFLGRDIFPLAFAFFYPAVIKTIISPVRFLQHFQDCGDIELAGYLVNETDPVPLVLDLRIVHERFGRSSDLSLNGNLLYPNDIDRSLNEDATDKIRKYRTDYNNNPPTTVSFIQLAQSHRGMFHYRRSTFSSHLKGKVDGILSKVTDLSVNLNIDGVSITSRTYTHPSHSQTSRLLTSSLFLGVPVPRPTEYIRDL